MLVTYTLEKRSPWFILAFAGSCALGSIYGFLQGAWPFGLIEAVWSGVALRRWTRAAGKRGGGTSRPPHASLRQAAFLRLFPFAQAAAACGARASLAVI